MEKLDRREAYIWLKVILFICISWVSHVTSQPDYLSIDCGSDEDYYDNKTGIYWVTDAPYASTGKNANNITVKSLNILFNKGQVDTLRYFDDPRSRDCYVLPMRPQHTYLVRPSFFFGDWENGTVASHFYVYLNNTFWLNLEWDTADDYVYYWEAIVYSPGNELNFCLVRQEGPSFISALEIRGIASGMYSPVVPPAGATSNTFLETQTRLNCGASPTGPAYLRYPDDLYDRFWTTPGSFDNATHITNTNINSSVTGAAPDRPPFKVMQDAWIYYHQNFLFYIEDFRFPVGRTYVTSYFQELDGNASATNVRGMTYYLNDKLITSFNSSNQPLEIYGPVQDIADSFVNVTFVQASWSKLVPMLNAIEIYFVFDYNTSQTAIEDVKALYALQTRLNLTDWTGDPCVPVPFDWMGCTMDGTNSTLFRVNNISLINMGITSTIPHEILNLTELTYLALNNNSLSGPILDLSSLVHLQTLYLQNNNLSGDIPGFLASALPNLTQLNLDHNNLTGTVPLALASRPGLNFSIRDNPDLNCNVTVCATPVAPTRQPAPVVLHGSKTAIGAVVGGIFGGLAVLAIIAVVLFVLLTKRSRARSNIIRAIGHAENQTQGEPSISRQALAGSMTLLSLQEVSDATKKFSKKIGEGSFGPVYYGQLRDGQEVAVKVKSSESRQGFKEFLNEVDILSRIHHRNLVSLVGFCEEGGQQILIYTYVPNGSLRDHLYGDKSRKHLNWRTRLDIALNSAKGLEYLHTDCKPRVIHRDVKTSNILLDENMVAKVSDFGISKQTPEGIFSGLDTVLKGTPGYFDPEYFITQRLTQKSDVYSFGVVLLEMISGRHPHVSELSDGTTATLIQWVQSAVQDGRPMDVVDQSLRGEFDNESFMKVLTLALNCTDLNVAKRPDMGQIMRVLEEAIELELFSEIKLTTDQDIVAAAIAEGEENYDIDSGFQSLPGSEVVDDSSIIEPR